MGVSLREEKLVKVGNYHGFIRLLLFFQLLERIVKKLPNVLLG
jgi:hypothetical protein